MVDSTTGNCNLTGASGNLSQNNTAIGISAGNSTHVVGIGNTSVGHNAGSSLVNAVKNSLFGANAASVNLINGSDNCVFGNGAGLAGDYSGCIVIGEGATATASGQLVLGSLAVPINTATVAARTGGAATALPANPVIWQQVVLNGVTYYSPLFS